MTLIEAYTNAYLAHERCLDSGNTEWAERWYERIEQLTGELPHGSGLDGTVAFDPELTKKDRVRILVEYHHMDANGYYNGWSTYRVIAVSTFLGVEVDVRGARNDAQVKDYLADLFHQALTAPAPPYPWEKAA